MENAARGLNLWMRDNASRADDTAKTEAEKTYVAPYNEAKAQYDESYQAALTQVPPKSELEKRVNKFYDDGGDWQREIAEPLVNALRDPKPLDALSTWRPFDEAENDFNDTRDALMTYRRAQLSSADRFRRFSTWNLLAIEGAAIVLAIVIGLGLSRAVTTPLDNMVAQSRRIESGDYRQTLVGGPDEFGEVTRAMNAMATSIGAQLEHEKLSGRLTAAVTRSLDSATVLQTTARALGEALQASRCVLCLTGQTPLWFQWQAPGIAPLDISHGEGIAFTRRVLESGQTLAVHEIELEDEELKAQGVRALLATPLLLRGESAGVIALHQCGETRQWTDEEIALLEHAAAQVAIALDNARLFHESHQRAEELQAARDALAASSARLQEKNLELEEFVYTVSHDLKAPLISIQGYLAALQQDFGAQLPKDAAFYLQRINNNAVQLESLIGELIELSRIGRVRETWEEADTHQLAREVAAELTLQAQSKAVQIDIAPDLPSIFCEKKRVRQMFLNLLDNAIKYSDPAKPVRKISVKSVEENDAYRFEIADNGLGIAAENLEKAFGIFQRVGHNNEANGSGIGLATVRRAAEAQGGRAWAQSDGIGQGTTFYFTISKNPDVAEKIL